MSDPQTAQGMPKLSHLDSSVLPIADPRIRFCTTIAVSANQEHFLFQLISGGVIDAQYAFSPQHAKRLKMILDKKIDEFEAEYGGIDTQLPDAPK